MLIILLSIQFVYENVKEIFYLKQFRTDYKLSVRAHDLLGPDVLTELNFV